MYAMNFDITIGSFRLTALERATVRRSVENLADTATITLPATAYNRALNIENDIKEGDPVCIRFGYDAEGKDLPVEFEGRVASIATDNGSIEIACEDEICGFRRELKNAVLTSVGVDELLRHVVGELGGYDLACDYDFRYDRFTIYEMTGFDVLKKVQEETRANIYMRGRTLHVHPQYAITGRKVIYDFAVNIEKSDLEYKDDTNRKFQVVVEGTDAQGRTVKVVRGTAGGDKFTLRLPGVSDRAALERRADEELKMRAYAGYEGNFTGWLVPQVEPADVVELRDDDYDRKAGSYCVVAVETSFAPDGGSRKITIGRRIA